MRYHHDDSDTMKLIVKYVDDNSAKLGSCLLFPMKEIIASLHTSRSHTHIFDNYHTTQSLTVSMNRSMKWLDSYMASKSLHNSTGTILRQSEQLEKEENSKFESTKTNCF